MFCQLDSLRHCFPQNLRQFINQMPETLDETYEQILKNINKAQKDDALRLLQCLTIAVRPLRVEELAELLAFDFPTPTSGGIPKLKEDWRWDDQEEAILSICSGLIAVVRSGDSRVVQFSHFSVKEYLTSLRLARSDGDISQFFIDLDAAHTILAQACLGTLLRLDDRAGTSGAKEFPLVKYAAQHWVDHARINNVSSRVLDGMDDLFDTSKPHFAAWLLVHDMDETWAYVSHGPPRGFGSPLYYAALCGFYDLAERLITKYPEQVNAGGGRIRAPLLAALYKRHFGVASLLLQHGAAMDIRDKIGWTPLHAAPVSGQVDIMRWLLNHGADANAQTIGGRTPLHLAALKKQPDAVRVLLEHNADVNLRNNVDETPLYEAISNFDASLEGKIVDIVRQLLAHGADTNIRNRSHSTLLHQASFHGSLKVAQLLLSHGANVDEKDGEGRSPFQVASLRGYQEIMKLLLEHGAERGAVPLP